MGNKDLVIQIVTSISYLNDAFHILGTDYEGRAQAINIAIIKWESKINQLRKEPMQLINPDALDVVAITEIRIIEI